MVVNVIFLSANRSKNNFFSRNHLVCVAGIPPSAQTEADDLRGPHLQALDIDL
uniref:Uncharacterized protein n=1 Tax=Schistosoma curassoni TaxID=6186 RepID=A0A183L7J2_9TREM